MGNTSESDIESDAGASPSAWDSDSSSVVSRRSSSPSSLQICENEEVVVEEEEEEERPLASTSPKKNITKGSGSKSKVGGGGRSKKTPNKSVTIHEEVFEEEVNTSSAKKRKRSSNNRRSRGGVGVVPKDTDSSESPTPSPSKRKKVLNKRRRTKSERNTRAGKVQKEAEEVGEAVEVALDAEIDRVLEEKAEKNNLTATNVKSILRHVLTNNMVQKFIMSTIKRQKGSGGGDSSDDENWCEPKLTRARSKLLSKDNSSSAAFWPLPPTAEQKAPVVSETHFLIHDQELPEDSSGDEEYVPKEEDEVHSDDESSSVASHASDAGSPSVSAPRSCSSPSSKSAKRNVLFANESSEILENKSEETSFFKTPPPVKPKKRRDSVDSGTIGQRTRSKLPLNDTPLEEIEMQFIPPDITADMYDWGGSDNEEYSRFLKEFLLPRRTEENDDDEADPEYNVMEEEEEHDKEELRMDRAVKISKKELKDLFAEWFEDAASPGMEELCDTTTELNSSSILSNLPPMSNPGIATDLNDSGVGGSIDDFTDKSVCEMRTDGGATMIEPVAADQTVTLVQTSESEMQVSPIFPAAAVAKPDEIGYKNTEGKIISVVLPSHSNVTKNNQRQPIVAMVQPRTVTVQVEQENSEPFVLSNLFDEQRQAVLEDQLRRHVQLLAQSYALTVTRDEGDMKFIAQMAKKMIIEIHNRRQIYGETSIVSKVVNCVPAWQFVNSWPARFQSRSPIKKKILVEHMNENTNEWLEFTTKKMDGHSFPRSVVQAIAESDAFIYPEHLPLTYDQKMKGKLPFLRSEDALLVLGLDQIEDNKLSNKAKVKMISEIMMPSRSTEVLYHRIRNLRKSRAVLPEVIRDYFRENKLPPSASIPVAKEIYGAPLKQPKENLSTVWASFISVLQCLPTEVGDLTPTLTRRKKLANYPATGSNVTGKNDTVITTTFPKGIGMVQEELARHPGRTAVPLMNSSGETEVYVFIPNYALPSASQPTTITPRKFYHPIPLYKREDMSEKVSPSNETNKSGCEGNTAAEESVLSITAVGRPVSLEGIENEVIDLSSLSTPIKQAVISQVQGVEMELSEVPETGVINIPFVNLGRENEKNHMNQKDPAIIGTRKNLVQESSMPTGMGGNGNVGESHSNNEVNSSCCEDDEDDDDDTDASVSDKEWENDFPGNISSNESASVLVTLDDDSIAVESDAQNNENSSSSKDTKGRQSSEQGSAGNNERNSHAEMSHNPNQVNQAANNDDDDGNGNEKRRRSTEKQTPDDHPDDGLEKEEDTEDPDRDVASAKTSKNNKNSEESKKRKNKGRKRTSASPPKKRSSRSVPLEAMLQDDEVRDQMVADAFIQAFLNKVKSTTESSHPGLHTEFIQLLAEAGETGLNQSEILEKVRSLFKNYPKLVAEFSTFLACEDKEGESQHDVNDTDFQNTHVTQAQINFLRHLEKYSERSPQLRTKIMQKFKLLQADPTLSEKEVADALAPYFQSNPVMLSAFQALFPAVYLPVPVEESVDFEEVDMETEATIQENPDMELVHLPEEKNVPATATCPCTCHESDVYAYSSRIKHCRECFVKFQDGKVYIHTGRITKQVNVEMVVPAHAQKLLEVQATIGEAGFPQNTKQEKKTEIVPDENKLKVVKPSSTSSSHQETETGRAIHSNLKDKEGSAVVGCSTSHRHSSHTEGHNNPVPGTSKSPVVSSSTNTTVATKPCSTIVHLKPWTFEEDNLLLTTCQSETSIEDAFPKLEALLPNRDRTEIESRCVELISLLQQTMGNSDEDD